MPVPTLVTDLSTTLASNSPAGSDNVFPDLDNYLRAMSGFIASIRDNSGNGWVSPYLPLTYSAGTANGVVYLNGSKVVTTGSALVFDGTNLGIGTSSPSYKLTVAGSSPDIVAANTGANGTRIAITASNTAAYVSTTYSGSGIPLIFNTAGIGAAGSTQMTLDSSGNLGLGVTPSAWASNHTALQITTAGTQVWADDAQSAWFSTNTYASASATYKYLSSSFAAAYRLNRATGAHQWFTAPSGTAGNTISFGDAKMTLDASGNLLVGKTTADGAERLNITGSVSNNIARFINTNASPFGPLIQYPTGVDPNGTSNEFIDCRSNVTTLRFQVRSNGGIANYQANDVNLSDRREKTNFAPAKSYLDTICAIPVQTFNYIDQSPDDPGLTLGVVAQDVQAVAPELVMESNWGTEDNPKMRLSIYQTDLQYALMKCIQEQQALITALTARVAALEA